MVRNAPCSPPAVPLWRGRPPASLQQMKRGGTGASIFSSADAGFDSAVSLLGSSKHDISVPKSSSVSTANMTEMKIAVLGSEGVGKSALIVRFLTRRFIGEYASSSECIYRKRLTVDGKQMNLELYDPCSQACEGKSTVNDQILWADGFIVVYDISDRSSFLTAKTIVHLIRELHLGPAKRNVDSLIFLVGNKQDLCHMREVRHEEGQCLAAEFHCQFYELSAAEHYQEVALIFFKMVQTAGLGSKAKERRRRPSGSKSMAKLINNVFGKRRKSV